MKNQQKIDYINKVNDRFTNARNHGHQGNNWWYPRANTITYNVKLHYGSKTIEDFREKMTARQNAYYSDDMLYDISNEQQNDEARMFSDDLDLEQGVKSGYAGRSGGWLEVEYSNSLEEVDENTDKAEVNRLYQEAQALDKLEGEIAIKIEKAHTGYLKYIASDKYVVDMVENLHDDEAIGDIYKDKAKGLLDKLK